VLPAGPLQIPVLVKDIDLAILIRRAGLDEEGNQRRNKERGVSELKHAR
jgi:hypothetical protein